MLWFLSSQAGVQRSLRFHSLPETSYYGGIHSIVKDDSGRLWFSSFIEVVDSHIVMDIVGSGEEILVLTTMEGLYKYSADGKIIGEVDIRSGKNGAKGMYMDKAGML